MRMDITILLLCRILPSYRYHLTGTCKPLVAQGFRRHRRLGVGVRAKGAQGLGHMAGGTRAADGAERYGRLRGIRQALHLRRLLHPDGRVLRRHQVFCVPSILHPCSARGALLIQPSNPNALTAVSDRVCLIMTRRGHASALMACADDMLRRGRRAKQ